MRSIDFFWKRPSPTESASSTTSVSAATWVAIEKPSRTTMPEEYSRTGRSMKPPSSLQATISGSRSRVSSSLRPSSAALSRRFWRPVKAGWKPEPSSRIAAIRPCTSISPAVGRVTPATSFSRVLLPAPFSPMIATASPRCCSKSIPWSARWTTCRGRRRSHSARRPRALS